MFKEIVHNANHKTVAVDERDFIYVAAQVLDFKF